MTARQIRACRSCGAPILFLRTRAGTWLPCEAESVAPGDTEYEPRSGHEPHGAHCPASELWRKDAKGG